MPDWWHPDFNKKAIEELVVGGSNGDFAVYPKKNGTKVYICVNDNGAMVQYSISIDSPHECSFAGFVSPNIIDCVNGVAKLSRKQPFTSKNKPGSGVSLKAIAKVKQTISKAQRKMSESLFDDDDDDFVIPKRSSTDSTPSSSPDRKKPSQPEKAKEPQLSNKITAMLEDDGDDDFVIPKAIPLAEVVPGEFDKEISFVKTSATVGLVVVDPDANGKYPVVSKVLSTSPASGLLNPKDEIVGVNGKCMEGQKKAAVLGLLKASSSTSTITFIIKGESPPPKAKAPTPSKSKSKTTLQNVNPSLERKKTPRETTKPTAPYTVAQNPTETKAISPTKSPTATNTTTGTLKAKAKAKTSSLFDTDEIEDEENLSQKQKTKAPVKSSLFTEEDDEADDDDNDHDITIEEPATKAETESSKKNTKKKSLFDDGDDDDHVDDGGDDDELDDLLGADDDLDSLMNTKRTSSKKSTTAIKAKKKTSSLFDDDDEDDADGSINVTDLGSLTQYIKANEGK